MSLIIEDGEELEVTDSQLEALTAKGLVYPCDECCGFYHIALDHNWKDIEDAITCQTAISP